MKICSNERVLILEGEIAEPKARHLAERMISLNESSSDDIYLFISSLGGSVVPGIAIYDVMRWCRCKINTICLDKTAALATLLLAAGSQGKRYAFIDSSIDPSQHFFVGNPEAMVKEKNEIHINNIINKTIQIIANHTGHTFDAMLYACLSGQTMDAKQAQDNGYIDKIIDETVTAHITSQAGQCQFDYYRICRILRLNGIL